MKNDEFYNANSKKYRNAGSFIIVSRKHLKFLKPIESILLAELIAIGSMKERGQEVEDGYWFECSEERIFRSIGLTEKQQRTTFNKLIEKGIIERKRKRMKAIRHVRISFQKLEELET